MLAQLSLVFTLSLGSWSRRLEGGAGWIMSAGPSACNTFHWWWSAGAFTCGLAAKAFSAKTQTITGWSWPFRPALKAYKCSGFSRRGTFVQDTSDKGNQRQISATFAARSVSRLPKPLEKPQGLKARQSIAEHRRHDARHAWMPAPPRNGLYSR
jgi:hypothetical protein